MIRSCAPRQSREDQRNASASRHPAVDQHAVHASSRRPMDRATLALQSSLAVGCRLDLRERCVVAVAKGLPAGTLDTEGCGRAIRVAAASRARTDADVAALEVRGAIAVVRTGDRAAMSVRSARLVPCETTNRRRTWCTAQVVSSLLHADEPVLTPRVRKAFVPRRNASGQALVGRVTYQVEPIRGAVSSLPAPVSGVGLWGLASPAGPGCRRRSTSCGHGDTTESRVSAAGLG